MKKICSLMLALFMIIATFAVISIPTAAADGQWSVYTAKSQYLDDFTGLPRNIPGYKYVTGEGLKASSGTNPNSTPWVTIQTTEKVDLRQGVYMQVRVDDFSYSGYSWFSFHVWDSQNVEPGKQGDEHGYGVETLIRVVDGDLNDNDKNKWPGNLNALQWYTDFEEGNRIPVAVEYATTNKNEDAKLDRVYNDTFNTYDKDQNPILTLEIKWLNPGFSVTINGAPAPDGFAQGMYDFFKTNGNDYQAHIGFTLQNPTVGGVAEATVLKFGTSATDAKAPIGDDKRDVEPVDVSFAEIADAETVEKGQPAIVLDGTTDFDSKGKPSGYNGNKMSVDENGFVHIKANSDGIATATFRVKDDVSFDAKDFPIVLIITRNFCTCTYEPDENGDPIVKCDCGEQISTKALAGKIMEADTGRDFKTMANESGENGKKFVKNYTDEAGNSYLSMVTNWLDTSLLVMSGKAMEGRIHGVRVDIGGVRIAEPGRDSLDICQVAFFRTVEEADAYAKAYIAEIGEIEIPEDPTVEENTQAPEETGTTPEETESETLEETGTEAPETDTADTSVDETDAPTETVAPDKGDETEPTKDPVGNGGNQQVDVNVGCSGTVGFGALAIVALAGAGLSLIHI